MPLPKDRPLALDEQICFTLYRTAMSINRTYKPMLDEMGITYPQYLVLNVLGEEDGRTIGIIAARLALDSSTITPLVKRMEAAGLVQRRRSPDNEREVQVRLTEAGRALFARSQCLGEALLAALRPDPAAARRPEPPDPGADRRPRRPSRPAGVTWVGPDDGSRPLDAVAAPRPAHAVCGQPSGKLSASDDRTRSHL